jgi:RsiW-degrading membrane proteinase PrsW (M82 family)
LYVSYGPFPVEEIQMEQRDWELLDKQVRGLRPPRNDGVIVLTWNAVAEPIHVVVAVFFAGMILGGLLVPHESELMRIASNDARTAISLPNGAAPTTWR